MYILKNAFISIWRNKGRNVLIAIIVTVIAAACAVTLAIRNSAVKIVSAYEEKYEIEATIGMDRSNMLQNIRGNGENKKSQEEMINEFNNIEAITVSEIKEYGESEYVKNYYYHYETSMDAEDLEEATDSLIKETTTTETTERTETFGNMPPGGGPGSNGSYGNKTTTNKTTTKTEKIFNEKAQNGAFSIFGYSSLESMTDFINGNSTVTSGTIFTNFSNSEEEFSCIISEELAEINELSVGDTITLVNHSNNKLTYEVTISGIYAESSDTSNDMSMMFTESANKIIVPAVLVEKMIEDDDNLNIVVQPTFILKDSDAIEKFSNEVREKGLSENYTVTNNLEIVEGATKSINNVKTFATTFLIITLIIGAVVLLVLNMINIRERKYEIGVLRTIGMKKVTVVAQFVFELLVVAIFGLMIGAGIGAVSSVKIANGLLETEINNTIEETENISDNFGGRGSEGSENMGFGRDNIDFNAINGMVKIEQVNSINAVVDFTVLLELLGIGVLLTMVSSISAGVAIARFSPLTILKERS